MHREKRVGLRQKFLHSVNLSEFRLDGMLFGMEKNLLKICLIPFSWSLAPSGSKHCCLRTQFETPLLHFFLVKWGVTWLQLPVCVP